MQMSIAQIKSVFTQQKNRYGFEEAKERFLSKHPELEGDLELVLQGYTDLPDHMRVKAAPMEEVKHVEGELVDPEDVLEVNENTSELAAAAQSLIDNDKPVEETSPETPAESQQAQPETAEKPKKDKKVKEPKEKVNMPPSKAELAREMYKAAVDKTRGVMIKRFMEELGLTACGSATYYQSCRKLFGK